MLWNDIDCLEYVLCGHILFIDRGITVLYNNVMFDTLESIKEAAMEEFLDKGFQGASLRHIVKNAGVTTGAFYGYFSSKEALFNALVEPHAAALMGRFMEAQITFAQKPDFGI